MEISEIILNYIESKGFVALESFNSHNFYKTFDDIYNFSEKAKFTELEFKQCIVELIGDQKIEIIIDKFEELSPKPKDTLCRNKTYHLTGRVKIINIESQEYDITSQEEYNKSNNFMINFGVDDCITKVCKELLIHIIKTRGVVTNLNIRDLIESFLKNNDDFIIQYISRYWPLTKCIEELLSDGRIKCNFIMEGTVTRYLINYPKNKKNLLGNPFKNNKDFSSEDRYLAFIILKEFDFFFLGKDNIKDKEYKNSLYRLKDKCLKYICGKYFFDTLYKYRNLPKEVKKFRRNAKKLASWYECDHICFVSNNLEFIHHKPSIIVVSEEEFNKSGVKAPFVRIK